MIGSQVISCLHLLELMLKQNNCQGCFANPLSMELPPMVKGVHTCMALADRDQAYMEQWLWEGSSDILFSVFWLSRSIKMLTKAKQGFRIVFFKAEVIAFIAQTLSLDLCQWELRNRDPWAQRSPYCLSLQPRRNCYWWGCTWFH